MAPRHYFKATFIEYSMLTHLALLAMALAGAAAQAITLNYYSALGVCDDPDASPVFQVAGTVGACYQASASATANCSLVDDCSGLEYPAFMACLGAQPLTASVRLLSDGSTEAWDDSASCEGDPSTVIDGGRCPVAWGSVCTGRYTDFNAARTGAAAALPWLA